MRSCDGCGAWWLLLTLLECVEVATLKGSENGIGFIDLPKSVMFCAFAVGCDRRCADVPTSGHRANHQKFLLMLAASMSSSAKYTPSGVQTTLMVFR